MIIGYEAKRIFHNRSGLGNYGRSLIRILQTYYPENQYLLYNPSKASIDIDKLGAAQEILPPISLSPYPQLWRQKLVSKRAAKDGVQIFHGLSGEIPRGLRKQGIASVLSVHDLIFLRHPEFYKKIDRKIYASKLKMACREADRIVAISEQTKEDLIDLLHIPADRIQVIYQGVDPIYRKEIDESSLRAVCDRYQLPERFALFVGTLEERKNPHLVLEAMDRTEIPTVFIGRPTDFWHRELKLRSPKPHLFLQLRVDSDADLAAIYRSADMFIYPSQFEGFGIPVLEALVSGTPVITSNISSLPEAGGPGAKLIEASNADALIAAMKEVWLQTGRAEQSIAEKQHLAQFEDAVIAQKWESLYRELV